MKKSLQNSHLILFFTRGVSLRDWKNIGMFDREVALYQRLQEFGYKVSFVTYGDRRDLLYSELIPGIQVLCNLWNLPEQWYSRLLPYLHSGAIRFADIIKTNQTIGADIALKCAKLWSKPLISRCGYMWSQLACNSGRFEEAFNAKQIEEKVFQSANAVVVTTAAMKKYVQEHYAVNSIKIRVIPNYVLTDIFVPMPISRTGNQICFIGRLSKEKNILALIKACSGLELRLKIIGDGPLKENVQALAKNCNVELELLGNVNHKQLPKYLHQSALFVLVSHHEGHPKALIEAMSCGRPVIGTDVPGIREIIKHRETGFLCEPTPEGIRSAIKALLADEKLRSYLGKNARSFVERNYSIDKIVKEEMKLYMELMGEKA